MSRNGIRHAALSKRASDGVTNDRGVLSQFPLERSHDGRHVVRAVIPHGAHDVVGGSFVGTISEGRVAGYQGRDGFLLGVGPVGMTAFLVMAGRFAEGFPLRPRRGEETDHFDAVDAGVEVEEVAGGSGWDVEGGGGGVGRGEGGEDQVAAETGFVVSVEGVISCGVVR